MEKAGSLIYNMAKRKYSKLSRVSRFSSPSDSEVSDRHEDTRFAAATLIIDTDGDLTMRFKGGELKASRKVLSLSSPVFQAMLGSGCQFKESTDKEFERDGNQTLSFEDDDFHTMAMIARIMHLQNNHVPDKLTFKQLYQVAVLCDKYDLKECLGPWPKIWAEPYLDSNGLEGYEGWLFMSIVFGNDELFKDVTRHLILNSKASADNSLVTTKGIDVSERVSSTIVSKMLIPSFMESSRLIAHRPNGEVQSRGNVPCLGPILAGILQAARQQEGPRL